MWINYTDIDISLLSETFQYVYAWALCILPGFGKSGEFLSLTRVAWGGLLGNTCTVSQFVTDVVDNCDMVEGVAELSNWVKSNISELKSSSETWLEVLTNKGTQILMLSVLELQSSVLEDPDPQELLIDDPEDPIPWIELFQLGPLSSRTQIFSPLMRVIWLTTWSWKNN